jgi:hypothetical protein
MTRHRALWLLAAVWAALMVVLVVLDGRMQDAGGPGILGFELAGSEQRAAEILADWGDEGQDAARLSLWLDFPYLVAYGAFLAVASLALGDAAARRGRARLARLARPAAAAAAGAAAWDVAENVCLLIVLGGAGGATAPLLATIFASAKFALLAAVLAYVLATLLALAATRARARRQA